MGEEKTDPRRRFEELALPLARHLHSTARRLTGNTEQAEELVQETFLRAYRTFSNFKPGTNARAWLFTILYSIVKNRYRQASRRPAELSLSNMEEHDARMPEAETWGSHEELLRRLDEHRVSPEIVRAFGELPPAWRTVILLVDVEELEYEEVARILDCPVGTISSRLYRARKRLFDRIAPLAREKRYLEGTSDG